MRPSVNSHPSDTARHWTPICSCTCWHTRVHVYPFNTHTQMNNAVNVLKTHVWYPQPRWLVWSSWHHVYQRYHTTVRATPSNPVTWWWDWSHMYTNQSMSMFGTNVNVSSGLRWNRQRQENVHHVRNRNFQSLKSKDNYFYQLLTVCMKFSEITNRRFRTLPAQSYLIQFTFKEILSHIMRCLWSVFLDTV